MVTGLCHCVSVLLYHLITEFDDIGSKRRVITTRPGHVNAVSKMPLSFGAINGIQISNQGQRSFL